MQRRRKHFSVKQSHADCLPSAYPVFWACMPDVKIVVIGGGGTGAALVHDLALRGFEAVLLERGELTSGSTGRHHGQLHCGARYAVSDAGIAVSCRKESAILERIASRSIEFNYGLFVALTDDDADYCETFLSACAECGIATRTLAPAQALQMEPNLNPGLRLAVLVPDGTFDAWRLPLQFFASARGNGADIRSFSEVIEIERSGGSVQGVRVLDYSSGREYSLKADLVINAAGAWAGGVAATAGVDVPVNPAPGVLVAVEGRLCNMVLSRLRPAADGDIIVPQRNMCIVGSTQWETADPDLVEVPPGHREKLLGLADQMLPGFSGSPARATWSAVRPLCRRDSGAGGHALSRAFFCQDHETTDGLKGMITVIGGKATVLRAMAETAVDLACTKVGLDIACTTRAVELMSHRSFIAG